MSETSSSNRVALVTGANKGIGYETVRQLAASGIETLLAARDEERGSVAAANLKKSGLSVEFLHLDVTDDSSVRSAARQIQEQFGRLDILINNAGVNLERYGSKTQESTLEVWRATFDVNLFGVIAVTNAFLPLLKKSAAGRIVNLSSILASLTLQSDPKSPIYDFKIPAYDSSKAALNAYTIHLAYELRDTKVKVNAAHPGWVQTEMGGDQAPMDLETGAKTTIMLATLPADGPSGTYVHLGNQVPW